MGAPTVSFAQVASPPPRISASPQGLTGIVKYRVAWSDAFTFVNQILGILDGQPWIWPASPNMRAYNAEIEPVGIRSDVKTQSKPASYGSSPGEYYEKALITVTFGSQSSLTTMPYTDTEVVPPALTFDQTNPIEMSSYRVRYATAPIKLPGGALTWSVNKADGSSQTVAAGVKDPESGSAYWRVPTFDLQITLHNCLYLDDSLVSDRIGKVNNATIFSRYPAETMLLDGVETSRREMSDGIVILDCTINYKYLAIGWNVCFGSNGELYRYVAKTSGTELYQKAAIHPNDVFPPPTRWKPYNLNGIAGR